MTKRMLASIAPLGQSEIGPRSWVNWIEFEEIGIGG
jgi:hypothetical protein